MVMGDRAVIVSLRKAIVGVMEGADAGVMMGVHVAVCGCCVVVVRQYMSVCGRAIVIMPVGMIGHRLNVVVVITMDDGQMMVVVVALIRRMLHINVQVMAVIEDRTRERGRRMIDLEGVFHAIQHDDRHLCRQRHAERHAEHGDAALGDCKPLADHDSSRSRVWNLGTIRERTHPRQVRRTPHPPHEGYRASFRTYRLSSAIRAVWP